MSTSSQLVTDTLGEIPLLCQVSPIVCSGNLCEIAKIYVKYEIENRSTKALFRHKISIATLSVRESSEFVSPERIIHIGDTVVGCLFVRSATANYDAHGTPAINIIATDP